MFKSLKKHTMEDIPKNLCEEIDDLYDYMIINCMNHGMVKYISENHRRDFILGVFSSIDTFKGENIESEEVEDWFYDFVCTNVKFFFWAGMSDHLSEDEQNYINFILKKIKE